MSTAYLIAAFEYDVTLELTITDLLQTGISKEQVKVVPMVKKNPNQIKLF